MNLIALACAVFDAAESIDTPHMAVGAIAAGAYGIPCSTKARKLSTCPTSRIGATLTVRESISRISSPTSLRSDRQGIE
jgi:hypothetical protein